MSSQLKDVLPGKPAVEDIIHKRNDDFILPLKGYNKDGTPYDFTGHTFLMQIKDKATDDVSVVEIDNDSFTIGQDQEGVDAGVNNIVDIEHTDEDFDIIPKEYVYDIEMEDSLGKRQTIVEGIFCVTQDVSRGDHGGGGTPT